MKHNLMQFIHQMDEIRLGKPWLGFSFKILLSRCPETKAFTSAGNNLFSPAQLLAHLTFWNRQIYTRVKTGIGPASDSHTDNWPENSKLKTQGWKEVIHEFDQAWVNLKTLLETKDDTFLDTTYSDPDFKKEFSYRFLLEGMIQHETYHMGQLAWALKMNNEKH
ncbi:DinB family protein [Sediminicola luteus]|uniref:DinB-like domain-containing protein n=1 Tax=Sediminicola luteus TaxID=319238 RepID=A0A2A4GE47_9FLAO|nr:DinB family protein [Sediminicola luteus]PCE66713.1 hypothetical protein B7P33_05325 [Sediminicola luteus]